MSVKSHQQIIRDTINSKSRKCCQVQLLLSTRLSLSWMQTTHKCVYLVTAVWPWPNNLHTWLDLQKMYLHTKSEVFRVQGFQKSEPQQDRHIHRQTI